MYGLLCSHNKGAIFIHFHEVLMHSMFRSWFELNVQGHSSMIFILWRSTRTDLIVQLRGEEWIFFGWRGAFCSSWRGYSLFSNKKRDVYRIRWMHWCCEFFCQWYMGFERSLNEALLMLFVWFLRWKNCRIEFCWLVLL